MALRSPFENFCPKMKLLSAMPHGALVTVECKVELRPRGNLPGIFISISEQSSVLGPAWQGSLSSCADVGK